MTLQLLTNIFSHRNIILKKIQNCFFTLPSRWIQIQLINIPCLDYQVRYVHEVHVFLPFGWLAGCWVDFSLDFLSLIYTLMLKEWRYCSNSFGLSVSYRCHHAAINKNPHNFCAQRTAWKMRSLLIFMLTYKTMMFINNLQFLKVL